MDTASAFDVWNQGDPYERYVGRWSRLVAQPFLDWLAMPAPSAGSMSAAVQVP